MLKLGMIDVEIQLGHNHLLLYLSLIDGTQAMLDMLLIIHNKTLAVHKYYS